MIKILLKKLSEAFVSVLPVTAIVFLLNLTPIVNFSGREIMIFLISSLFLILGIGLFNLGADIAMTPMGEHIGAGLSKTKKVGLLLSVCFAMGLLITVAEPDLSVLAGQVADVLDPMLLIVTVGLGVGIFLLLSVLKIIFKKNLSSILIFFYMLLFAITSLVVINGNSKFLPLAFDSGGVTTGPITVPFIMALGVGIATTLGGKKSAENSFGLIAMCSIGPILAVMGLGIFASDEIPYKIPIDYNMADNMVTEIPRVIGKVAEEVLLAIALIVAFFLILQFFCLKLPKKKLLTIFVGILYTVIGLIIFLATVNIGFMPIGYKMGCELAESSPYIVVAFGFVIGMVVVLAEPAVHVLNKQVEEITSGTVSKRSMMIALSLGVGVSIGLSMLRIVLGFNILYYLIPGYFISLGLTFFVPGLYSAIAFDSGGVASGPLTSTFILPFAVGVCFAMNGTDNVMTDAFGIVAMVAMTPLITIQTLGFKAIVTKHVRERIAIKRILDSDDEQIISFM